MTIRDKLIGELDTHIATCKKAAFVAAARSEKLAERVAQMLREDGAEIKLTRTTLMEGHDREEAQAQEITTLKEELERLHGEYNEVADTAAENYQKTISRCETQRDKLTQELKEVRRWQREAADYIEETQRGVDPKSWKNNAASLLTQTKPPKQEKNGDKRVCQQCGGDPSPNKFVCGECFDKILDKAGF